MQFRCEDGNRNDSVTHQATWDALVRVTGSSGFLYVADSVRQEALLNPAVMEGHRRAFVAASALKLRAA